VKRDVARSYLDELGSDLIRRLGYDPDELIAALPKGGSGASLWDALITPDELLPWWHRCRLTFAHSVYQRGVTKTIARFAFIALRGHAWIANHDHIDRRPV
jgi:hypothetical protein